jgi:Glyoxalase-like domain
VSATPFWPPFWLSAFLDLPAADHGSGLAFWSAVTGYAVSDPRGADGEFATLVPPDGDDYLRVQRLGDGPARIHLDLHVDDPAAAAATAEGLGAGVVHRSEHGHVVLSSPGGLTFCCVSHPAATIPAPAAWPGVTRSRVYQVCLDVPADGYDDECAFWAGLTGGSVDTLERRPEFAWLRGRRQLALDVLLQRLDRPGGPVTAHLDLGTTDRSGEVARHVALGAGVLRVEDFWTVLTDPAGLVYCVTDRDPATGRLA